MMRFVYPYCPAGWAGISPVVRAVPASASRACGLGFSTSRWAAAKETGRARAVPVGAVNGPRG